MDSVFLPGAETTGEEPIIVHSALIYVLLSPGGGGWNRRAEADLLTSWCLSACFESQGPSRDPTHLTQNVIERAMILDPRTVERQLGFGEQETYGLSPCLACPVVVGAVTVSGVFVTAAHGLAAQRIARLCAAPANEADVL